MKRTVLNTKRLARSRFNRWRMSGIDAPMAPAIAKEAVKKVKPNIIFSFQFSVASNQLRRVSDLSIFLLLENEVLPFQTRNGLLFRGHLAF
jgi:uncharacterized lipoprotein YddW (UPF0748 family)